jgi:gliding motility-associated-like protein
VCLQTQQQIGKLKNFKQKISLGFRNFPAKIIHPFILMGIFLFSQNLSAQNTLLPKYTDCEVSEKYAYTWYFGENAGLYFRNDSPGLPVVLSVEVNQFEGCSCISDSIGNFQFFTTGFNSSLKNNYGEYLENGTGLTGNYSATQSSLIIPQPGHPGIYYVFQVNIPYYDEGLTYSVVNMETAQDSGEVIQKNELLLPKVSEKITAVKHANGKDIWVFTHTWGDDAFYAYLINSEGLFGPVVSNTGIVHTADMQFNNAIGYMKASPDGKKIALVIYGLNTIEILDIDNETGLVSNAVTSNPEFTGVYGLEFSPDVSRLYVTTIDLMGTQTFVSQLLQFSVSDGATIFDNPIEIATSTGGSYFCGLQLAPDARIYISKTPLENDHLDVIFNPNRPGVFCNYNYFNGQAYQGLNLGTGKAKFGLPNFIQSYFDIEKFIIDGCCQKDFAKLRLTNTSNVDSVHWLIEYGNTSVLASNEDEPTMFFGTSGIYNLSITDYFEGEAFEDKFTFEIFPEPDVNIGKDTTLLDFGKTITLDAGPSFFSYDWNTGSTSSYMSTADSGLFWVDVSDFRCCRNADTTRIVFIDLFVPNAFTPNNDGVNDVVYVRGHFFTKVDLKIFNRAGEMVFHTTDQNKGWDGKYNGTLQGLGVYYFHLIAYFGDDTRVERKGNITLIR